MLATMSKRRKTRKRAASFEGPLEEKKQYGIRLEIYYLKSLNKVAHLHTRPMPDELRELIKGYLRRYKEYLLEHKLWPPPPSIWPSPDFEEPKAQEEKPPGENP